jgi:hypothetical protein
MYVGMDIKYCKNGEVQIIMDTYLGEAIVEFPEDSTATASTPAATYLFEVNDDCTNLSEPKRKILHSITAKLLFVTKRARPDISVPMAFLSSRVTKADEEDWKKLKRLLQYIHGTINMPLTLSIDSMSIMKTWVDASYAIHHDMRSHTGGNIAMGKGTLYSKSAKQKLNTKSSTEAELVGASDFLPQTLWTRNFIERIQDRRKRFLPRKHECYANGTQRPRFSRTTIPVHKYQIFLHCRLNRTRRGESRPLPYRTDPRLL